MIIVAVRRMVLAVLLLALAVTTVPMAAAQVGVDAAAPRLRQAETDVRAIERRLTTDVTDVDRALMRARLSTARQSAAAVAKQVTGEIGAIDARVAGLGAIGTGETLELRKQRTDLAAERLALDATAKRARLLDVEAEQLGAEIGRLDAAHFGKRMARRVASPVTPAFWGTVAASFGQDVAKIGVFVDAGYRRAQARGLGAVLLLMLLATAVGYGLMVPARRGALRLGQRYLISDAPGHRLRRSAYALWATLVGTVLPLLAAVVFAASIGWATAPVWSALLFGFILSAGFAAFTAAVLGALLMRSQPSWRVAPIGDAVAERLRPLSWVLAGLSFAGGMIQVFNTVVGASAAALAASRALEAGVSLVLIGAALVALGRLRAAETDRDEFQGNAALSALALVLWIVVVFALVALVGGYVELGQLVVNMIVWATVVGATTYLLMRLVDDAATAVFSRSGRFGRTLVRGVGVRASAVDQIGVLLSGAARVVLGVVSVVLLLAPLSSGSGVAANIERIASVLRGVEVGGIAISPGTILRGFVVLLIGLALVRGFTGWLEKRYLPATELDGSGRNSVGLIARYVGVALAAIWALASLGVGVEKIAILLSALSVGIGFGLQAITQNFISGLILLTERPIKIGDLIKVGNDEGDVKRISVRSTELALSDHSTLIIPNSELITKSVLNKTLASPLGRVRIQFAVPIDADVDVVQQVLLDAYAAEPAVLEDPAPAVFIDAVADGQIVFNSFAHVSGPRAVYGARSNVYKTLLRKLREAGQPIATAPPTAPAKPSSDA